MRTRIQEYLKNFISFFSVTEQKLSFFGSASGFIIVNPKLFLIIKIILKNIFRFLQIAAGAESRIWKCDASKNIYCIFGVKGTI